MKLSTFSTKISRAITFARVNELCILAVASGIAPAAARQIAAPRITELRIARASAMQFNAAPACGPCVTTLYRQAFESRSPAMLMTAQMYAESVRRAGGDHNSDLVLR